MRLTAVGLILAALAVFGARQGYVIKGQVQDERGEAARGVRVCAFVEGFDQKKPNVRIPCALSDVRGQFAIDVSVPGKYTLFYYNDANGYLSQYLPFFRHPSHPAPEVVLDGAVTAASVTISMLPKNGVLVGQGVDAETGIPVDNLEFILCHADAPEVCWQKSARSAEGKFKIWAAHVPFTVRVKAEGYDDWFGPDGGEKQAAVNVAPDTRRELNVRLKRSAASAGRALDESEKREGVNLPAPVQTEPAEGAIFDYYPRRTRLEWAPVEGAVSYLVEVDYCSGRRREAQSCIDPQPLVNLLKFNPPTSGIKGTSYEFAFVGAQPGRWRVWAVDAAGREGFKSPWRMFVYLR
jgi:hypothetical protein